MYRKKNPTNNMASFSYWKRQIEADSHGCASSWGVNEEDPSPPHVWDRLVASAKSNKAGIINEAYMIGDRVSPSP